MLEIGICFGLCLSRKLGLLALPRPLQSSALLGTSWSLALSENSMHQRPMALRPYSFVMVY